MAEAMAIEMAAAAVAVAVAVALRSRLACPGRPPARTEHSVRRLLSPCFVLRPEGLGENWEKCRRPGTSISFFPLLENLA